MAKSNFNETRKYKPPQVEIEMGEQYYNLPKVLIMPSLLLIVNRCSPGCGDSHPYVNRSLSFLKMLSVSCPEF